MSGRSASLTVQQLNVVASKDAVPSVCHNVLISKRAPEADVKLVDEVNVRGLKLWGLFDVLRQPSAE